MAGHEELGRPVAFDNSETWGEAMNQRKNNLALRYHGLAKAVYLACLGMAGQQAVAQQSVEEITVTGSRLISSGVNTPTPVTAVTAADLQAMAPTTLIESLSQ
jgi:hypothetical protein